MSLNSGIAIYGSDQSLEPPDTQLAAGPTYLAEAINSNLSIWTKTGTQVTTYDLNTFFTLPAGQRFSDPRILFDAESGRWFLSGMGFSTANNSAIVIAVSATSDPTGTWTKNLITAQVGVLGDQPFIGINSDKVVISWNDYTGSAPSTAVFSGAETWVLEKADLIAGIAARFSVFGLDPNRVRLVPAQSLSPSNTAWLAYDNADCLNLSCNAGGPTIGVISITGTPAAANVAKVEYDLPMPATNVPPNPRQPSGVPVSQEIDDRFLSAVWQNGTLWVTGNDSCIPQGDTTARSCLRLVGVSTGGASPVVAHEGDVQNPGIDIYYPALTLNQAGDLFITYSESSPTMYASAATIDSLAASPLTLNGPITLAQGLGPYSHGSINRWGDYSGAARDPSNPNDVWLTAEYQPSPADARNWGTVTGRIAIQPAIGIVSPSTGLPAGGQVVTLSGDHFQPGASVVFGNSAATNVTVNSTTQITVTTPPGATTGTVDVTVNQPDGTRVIATSAFTYSTTLGTAYTPLTPARLLDTRLSGGALGAQGSRNLTVTGGATGVPTGAKSVVLNVTVTNTTAASYLTVYAAGSPRPAVSNLNWVAGGTVPNLVVVPVGSNGQVTFFNQLGSTHLVVDLEGYFIAPSGSAGAFQPLTPARLLDTRTGAQTKLGSNASLKLQVTNVGGVPPTGVSAVVMNVTVTNPAAASFLTVWPSGASMPLASNLNFTAGETVANRVMVAVGTGGQVSMFNSAGSTDVVADVAGYFTDATASAGQLFYPVSPFRLMDSRLSAQTLGPGGNVSVLVAGQGAVPVTATGAVLNLTATNTTAPSYFTAYPSGAAKPTASDLNWMAGRTVPNLVVVKLGSGSFSIFNGAGSADAVVDVFGYFAPP